jgi:hypothetical protein
MKELIDSSHRRFARRAVVDGEARVYNRAYQPPDDYDGRFEGHKLLFLRYFREQDGTVVPESFVVMVEAPRLDCAQWMIWSEVDSIVSLPQIAMEGIANGDLDDQIVEASDSIMDEIVKGRPDDVASDNTDPSADDLFT